MSDRFLYQLLSKNASPPKRQSADAAGYDLASAVEAIVPARGNQLIATDLILHVPRGCYGRIAPRSGLAWKHSLDVGAGVIDADYRGNVGIILFNHSDLNFEVRPGDRIAQLILERIATPEPEEVTQCEARYVVCAKGTKCPKMGLCLAPEEIQALDQPVPLQYSEEDPEGE